MCSVLTGVLYSSFLLSPLMQSLLSGDFEDLLCESLEASSVKEERQQVSGVELEREGHPTPSPPHTSPHSPPPHPCIVHCRVQWTVLSSLTEEKGRTVIRRVRPLLQVLTQSID